jgi:PST family polysaccharide transporter
MVIISVVVALPMTFLSTLVISLLFGDAYRSAGPVLAVHIWASVFVFLGVASSKWFLAENRQLLSLQRTVLGGAANIALNLWWIPSYGALGAAFATVVSYAIAAFFSDLIQKETKKMFWMKVDALNPSVLYKRYL